MKRQEEVLARWRHRVAIIQQAIEAGDAGSLRVLEDFSVKSLDAVPEGVTLREWSTVADDSGEVLDPEVHGWPEQQSP